MRRPQKRFDHALARAAGLAVVLIIVGLALMKVGSVLAHVSDGVFGPQNGEQQ